MIAVNHISKTLGTPPTHVLKDISFEIGNGDFIALTGRSGSGKSTLLYILSSLDAPSEGAVLVDGIDLSKQPERELCRFRNEKIGFVFQFHYLIAELTAVENVLLPARRTGQELGRRKYAEHLLEQVGLRDKLHRLPGQLSGGEQQRVAIARSLVMEPRYLFADEPTGALDSVNGDMVMNMLRMANQESKTTMILVTHDPDFAKLAPRQILLSDGQIARDAIS